jgi:hypothetical protein
MNLRLGWMALALMSLTGVFVAGCGDECTDAAAKWEECTGSAWELEGAACSGERIKCLTTCINIGSCVDINASLEGTQNGYSDCVAMCPAED